MGATHPVKRGGAQKIVEKKTPELKRSVFFWGFFGVEFLDSKKRNGWLKWRFVCLHQEVFPQVFSPAKPSEVLFSN